MKLPLILITAGLSFLLTCCIIPILLRLSHRFHWYDDTNHRKIHSGNIPRIGGVGIFLSFLLGLIVFLIYMDAVDSPLFSSRDIIPILLGGLIIHITGLYDDFRNIRPLYKLLIQILAAVLVVFSGHSVEAVYLPIIDMELYLGFIGDIIAVVWLVGLSNAVNFIDGMDGLSSGVSALVLTGLGLLFVSQGYILSAALAFSLLGGILGFLAFNKPPARIFMGDCGSLFIGFLLASLPLVESTKSNSMSFLLTITLLLVPILDTFSAMLRRRRRHLPMHAPDKEHLHHKLLSLGLTAWGVLGVIYGLGLLLLAAVLYWVFFPGTASAIGILLSWIILFVFFLIVKLLSKKQKAEEQPSS